MGAASITTCKNTCGLGQNQGNTFVVNPWTQRDVPSREVYNIPEAGLPGEEPWEKEHIREREEREREQRSSSESNRAEEHYGAKSGKAMATAAKEPNPANGLMGSSSSFTYPSRDAEAVKIRWEPEVVAISNGDAAGGSRLHGANSGETYGVPGSVESYWTSYFGREAAELRRLPPPMGGAGSSSHRRHTFRTGAVYDGEWLGNERSGFGTQTWADGAEYQGEWRQNTASGRGCFKHCDGDVYIGQWRQNMKHGYGVYLHRDGTQYQGEFLDDLQDGYGVESWPDRSQFQGRFRQGKKSPVGIYKWPDGSQYVGQWSGNQIDGNGAYLGADGRRFDGKWRASVMHGCGRYSWPDGRTYWGQYLADQKDGFGTFIWADGRRYQGYWVAGSQHGLGRVFHQEGPGGVPSKIRPRLARWATGERVAWIEEAEEEKEVEVYVDASLASPVPSSIDHMSPTSPSYISASPLPWPSPASMRDTL